MSSAIWLRKIQGFPLDLWRSWSIKHMLKVKGHRVMVDVFRHRPMRVFISRFQLNTITIPCVWCVYYMAVCVLRLEGHCFSVCSHWMEIRVLFWTIYIICGVFNSAMYSFSDATWWLLLHEVICNDASQRNNYIPPPPPRTHTYTVNTSMHSWTGLSQITVLIMITGTQSSHLK